MGQHHPHRGDPMTTAPAGSTRHALSIALVRQRYTSDGGAERFVARLASALARGPAQVTVLTRSWQAGQQFSVVRLDPFFLGRVWRDWSFARAVCRELAHRRYDLVQSHERIACCDIYRAGDGVHREWLAQRARTLGALGRVGQGVNPYHLYTRRAEWRLFTAARLQAVICNSEMVKAEIQRHFGVAAAKLHVIYNGVDLETFEPGLRRHRAAVRARYAIAPQAPLFLFVGSGFERKGVARLLAAAVHLPPDAHLVIVGRDKRSDRYVAQARALGLAPRVHFVGVQDDVKPFYGAADALVLPTLYDPFPNVALEAMASGLPLITSDKCGAAELIRNGENGYVCDALDITSLAHAMTQLLSPERSAAAGLAARRTAESFDVARTTAALLDLYERCLHR